MLIGVGMALLKLFLSFLLAFFLFTIGAVWSVGPLVFLLGLVGIIDSDTATTVFECAVGIGFFIDVVRFIMNPGGRLSDTIDNFREPISTGSSSSSDTGSSREEPNGVDEVEKYMKCCGSCKWFSSNSSSYSICTLFGGEKHCRDSCSDWQRC